MYNTGFGDPKLRAREPKEGPVEKHCLALFLKTTVVIKETEVIKFEFKLTALKTNS